MIKRRPVALLVSLAVLVALLVATGYVSWQVWGTVRPAREQAAKAVAALRADWAAGTIPDQRWILRVPALGDTEWPVTAGTGGAQLDGGVGWYSGTSEPGQVGNFAVAGRRITGGEPFRRLLDLPVGTEVYVETAEATYVYALVTPASELTVSCDDSWVLEPVPGRAGQSPNEPVLTLTTNEDLVSTPDLAVAFGKLSRTETK